MKSAKCVLLSALITLAFNSFGQNSVGIGVATPNKNAVLELISPGHNQGILIPKLSTAQRTATSFVSELSNKENGLMVFDSDLNQFFYWETSQWKEMGTASGLLEGNGVTIVNNTISTIPQDLEFDGTILKITNNATAAEIDLSVLAVGGTAGGDLTGTYPNPSVANNAINSAKIADGSIVSADILDNTIATGDIFDGTIALADMANNSVNTNNIVDLTITNADVSNTANINVAKLSVGTAGQVLTTSGGVAGWANPSGTSLINNVGTQNLFAGANVGFPSGFSANSNNTFYGFSAGGPGMTGSWNVAVGSQAGTNNVSGNLNVLVGWAAGNAIATATFNGNTFIGAQAGQSATGGPNTFVGEKSGQATTTGTENVFLGNRAGMLNTTGGRNTVLGYFADVATANLQNSIAIGYGVVVDASNKVRIGNGDITVIQGQVGFTAASDRRLKTNIESLTGGLDLIMKLRPVSYNMKNSSDTRTNWGFIAQDIEALVGDTNAVLTVGADKDRTLGLRYSDFVAPLVKAVQEQQDQISDLNNKLGESEKRYETLAAELEQIKKAIGLKASNK